jgi:hypothetical protein
MKSVSCEIDIMDQYSGMIYPLSRVVMREMCEIESLRDAFAQSGDVSSECCGEEDWTGVV